LTATGRLRSLVPRSPSCPSLPRPQQYALPPARPQLCIAPTVMVEKLRSPVTGTAPGPLLVVPPSPSCLFVSSPQPTATPPLVRAQAWARPTASRLAPAVPSMAIRPVNPAPQQTAPPCASPQASAPPASTPRRGSKALLPPVVGVVVGVVTGGGAGAAATVSRSLTRLPSDSAWISAVPGATAVMTPPPLTVATWGALEDQVTPRSWRARPRASRAAALQVTVSPTLRVLFPAVSTTLATGTIASATVTTASAVFPSTVAVIVALPLARPVTTP